VFGLETVSPVAAAVSCGTTTHSFDGGVTSSPNYYVSGTINDRSISLCSGIPPSSGASAWLMIAGGCANEYAQIGFGKLSTMSSTKRFTEYNDGSNQAPGWVRTFYLGFSGGSTHNYVVSFSFTTGHVSMTVDGSTKATTPWGADTTWCGQWTGQINGETLNTGDDVPGTASAKTHFGSLLVKECRGCSLVSPSWLALGSDRSYYKINVLSSQSFDIWTQR
jgi:hypothetical protein